MQSSSSVADMGAGPHEDLGTFRGELGCKARRMQPPKGLCVIIGAGVARIKKVATGARALVGQLAVAESHVLLAAGTAAAYPDLFADLQLAQVVGLVLVHVAEQALDAQRADHSIGA